MGKVFVGIPVLNRADLLEESIRCVDMDAHIYVVNNNVVDVEFNEQLHRLQENYRFELHEPRHNLGVAASWNRIIRTGMGLGYENIYIGSNDTYLRPGTLEYVEGLDLDAFPDLAMVGIHCFHAFMIPTSTIAKVGWFDENFYPGYLEDVDYVKRIGLAGLKRYDITTVRGRKRNACKLEDVPPGLGATTRKTGRTMGSDPGLHKMYKEVAAPMNEAYMSRKWGRRQKVKHKIPFGGSEEDNPDKHDYRWWPDPGGTIATRDYDVSRTHIR